MDGFVDEKPKKSYVGLIVGIVVAIIVMLAAICVLLSVFVFGESAEEKGKSAFDKMAEESEQYGVDISNNIGFDSIDEYANENAMHAYLDLSVTLPQSDSLENASLTLDGVSDLANKTWGADVEVGAYGISIQIGSLAYADNNLYVQSRYLGSLAYRIALDNFAQDFNNSLWSQMIEIQIPENAISDYKKLSSIDFSGYFDAVDDLVSDVRDNFEYSSIKGKKEFELDGKTQKCTGIEVTLPKDYVDEIISDFFEEFKEGYTASIDIYESYGVTGYEDMEEIIEIFEDLEIEDDFVFDIYVDSKGRIVNMSTPDDIEFSSDDSDGEVSFDFNFVGSDRRMDEINGDLYIKVNGNIVCMNVQRTASATDDAYDDDMIFTLTGDSSDDEYAFAISQSWDKDDFAFDINLEWTQNNQEIMAVTANGNFDDIVKGQAYTFNLKNAKISAEGENLIILSGSYTYEPSDDEIEIPSDSIDFLKMTQSDIQSMMYSILASIGLGAY